MTSIKFQSLEDGELADICTHLEVLPLVIRTTFSL
jgi:hypothetical protein